MRVWIVKESGGPFLAEERPIPQVERGEVLIRVAASGVNPLDTKIRAGNAAHAKHPLPAVLGIDVAGTIERVGAGVTNFAAGDEVYGMAGGVAGIQGSLAEYMTADARLLSRKPRNLTMLQAAVMPLGIITAWEGLVDRAKIHAGQSALVHGGTGGVGHMAVQLAIAFGAMVHATVSSGKAAIVTGYGAIPIDYQAQSPEQYLRLSPGGHGWDVVFDTVGGTTLDASFTLVRKYSGHVLSALGWGTHSLAPLSFRGASYSGVFTLLPLLTGEGRSHHGEILAMATELAESGKLVPLLNCDRFTTMDIDAAHEAVTRGSLGKIAVQIRD